MIITTILLMAVITFTSRYTFLHHKLPFTVGPKLQRFLSFSAPAVLTAIWVPIVFVSDDGWQLNPTDPYLLGATTAIVVAYKTKSIYLTTGLSMVVFWLAR